LTLDVSTAARDKKVVIATARPSVRDVRHNRQPVIGDSIY